MHIMGKRSATMLTPLALLLCAASTLACAGCATISIDAPPTIKCLDLIPPELWADTHHAPPPASSASKDWVNFGIGEAGQLNKANEDKRTVHSICTKVDQINDAALKQAKHKTHKFLGLF